MIVEFHHVAWATGLVTLWSGFLVGVIRALFARAVANLEQRMEDVARQSGQTDTDLRRMMAEMPLHYQRREDSVREMTTLFARLDALGAKADGYLRRDDYVRDMTLIHAKLDALVHRLDRFGD